MILKHLHETLTAAWLAVLAGDPQRAARLMRLELRLALIWVSWRLRSLATGVVYRVRLAWLYARWGVGRCWYTIADWRRRK